VVGSSTTVCQLFVSTDSTNYRRSVQPAAALPPLL